MVQKMTDKFKEYKYTIGRCALSMAGTQSPTSKVKTALRQLPNEITNMGPSQSASPPRLLALDSEKVLGTKRQHTESTSSASSLRLASNNPATGHLVYVRRKVDVEGRKIGSCVGVASASLDSRKSSSNGMAEDAEPLQEPNHSLACSSSPAPELVSVASPNPPSLGPFPQTLVNPNRGFTLPEVKDSVATTTKPFHAEPKNLDSQSYWNERFHRLQIFLENCDQSNQEDYIQMLRSLSTVGRSEHAVELEKRAIKLLLEEGKELHRMRVLNVLGKALPNDLPHISTTTRARSPTQVEPPKVDKAAAEK